MRVSPCNSQAFETTESGDQLATTRVGSQDDGKLVTWRLHSSGPTTLRAIDVISEGRSVGLMRATSSLRVGKCQW